jgi:hypothetical protein
MSNTPNGNTPNGNTPNGFAFVGSGGFSDGWSLADRTDIPFVTDRDTDGLIASLTTVRDRATSFKDHDWAAKWNAWLLLFEFIEHDGITDATKEEVTKVWKAALTDSGGKTAQAKVTEELDELVRAASDERAEALGEILCQDAEIYGDFMSLLSMTPGSHPKTYRLLQAAGMIGLYGVMFFKGVHKPTNNRPRPSQLRPALMPPIPLPGHAAFPSGHATLAYLMAFCVGIVFEPGAAGAPPQYVLGDPPAVPHDPVVRNLLVLARRIARNREIAGLHYESDSVGGRVLAQELLKTLIAQQGNLFTTLVADAREEWQ